MGFDNKDKFNNDSLFKDWSPYGPRVDGIHPLDTNFYDNFNKSNDNENSSSNSHLNKKN